MCTIFNLRFLKSCKQEGLILVFSRIKYMGCTRQSKSTMRILKQCSFKLIGNEIRSKYCLLSNIKLDCSMMECGLTTMIALNDWMEFLEFARLYIARKANVKRHKLELKLKSLR
ncbi:hypothetical protein GJ496_005298 [Pomphorhynchus laevis]|nr:hypothetical protein GJ496_005298 [Pomphorhynchus laevis]